MNAAFFSRLYDETMALLVEARNHSMYCRPAENASHPGNYRLEWTCQELRVTARLTQVMAWLLVQKAVHSGEMTLDESLDPRWRLSDHDVCLYDGPTHHLSEGLRGLLRRSRELFVRVERLERLILKRLGLQNPT